jgi:hypothetical protein
MLSIGRCVTLSFLAPMWAVLLCIALAALDEGVYAFLQPYRAGSALTQLQTITSKPISVSHDHALSSTSTTDDNGEAAKSWLGVKLESLEVTPRPAHLNAEASRARGMSNFLEMFRSSAPYIRMHRGTTMVLHIPGECLEVSTTSYFIQ